MSNCILSNIASAFFTAFAIGATTYAYFEFHDTERELQLAMKKALGEAAKELVFLPEGMSTKKGTADPNQCFRDRDSACKAAIAMASLVKCSKSVQLVDAKPLLCDCSSQGCGEDWSCAVPYQVVCDTDAECSTHKDCPDSGKGWLCRERRCTQTQ